MEPGSVTALIIPVTGDLEVRTLNPTLETMQQLVGGYIEPVYLREDFAAVMFVNGDGKLQNLPVNRVASVIAVRAAPPGRPADMLVGDCAMFGLLDSDGNRDSEVHDVPQSVLALCEAMSLDIARPE